MNSIIIILLFLVLICVVGSQIYFMKKTSTRPVTEYFSNKNSLKFPKAIATIQNGRIKSVKILEVSKLIDPSFFRVSLVNNVSTQNLNPGKIRWNNNGFIEIVEPGSGYVVPPQVVFLPRKEFTQKQSKNKKPDSITISATGMWDDIPKNQRDELANVTQEYLREQKYSESLLENLYPQGVVSKNSSTNSDIEWMYPIEFSGIKLFYNQSIKNVKLIQIRGYNENGVEIFFKELIFSPIIEWKYNALIKKLNVIGPQWDTCDIMARRVYWTCEEYTDFVEQLKEAVDKPGKSSSKYEDDDTTIVYSEVLSQLPPDFPKMSRDEYINYFSTMENHCLRKTKEQMDADKMVEDQEIAAYQNMIQEQQKQVSKYKDKLLQDYQMMVQQYEVDVENKIDAEKYGITAPEFKYTKKEIDDLKKRIESIQNIPEEQLLRECSKVERLYNKKRKSAEKWAKASIFLPFLKKKAKRESKKAEKYENIYQSNCAELVALSYAY